MSFMLNNFMQFFPVMGSEWEYYCIASFFALQLNKRGDQDVSSLAKLVVICVRKREVP